MMGAAGALGWDMAAREYLNFDLELGPRGEGYIARVRASPVGEARGTFTLPFTPEGLENVVLRLGRSRTTVRRIASRQDELVKGFGSSLYDAVFAGEVGTSLRRSIDEAARQGKGLRIRLQLEDVPELGDVPWELLFVPGLSRHLVLAASTPLVRYLGLPGTPRPLRVEGPIRVLLVVAAPIDVVRLDAAHEVALIEEATADLRRAGVIALDSMAGGTLRELQRRLRRAEYHVLHFIGHGGFDERIGEGVLAFEDDAGHSQLVPTSHLGTILADHATLRLAILNACEGARASATDPFAGIAPGLIRQGIPAVIAMQFEVTDTAAAIFGHEFYLALADGCPVDQAAAEARKAMYASDCDVEWATPVLYLRASDGRIFDTPSIDRSGLERPAFLGAAPVDTGDLVKPAGRPAPAAEREPAAPAAVHEPPPVAPPPATVPVAATPRARTPSPEEATKDARPPPHKPVEPKPDQDDAAAISPWALPFPVHVDDPAAKPRRAVGRGHTPGAGRADAPRTSRTGRSMVSEPSRRGGVEGWTSAEGAWEGTASGGAWPPAPGNGTIEDEYPTASSSGGGRWLVVLLLVFAVGFVAWLVLDGDGDDGGGVTEPSGRADDTGQTSTNGDTRTGSTERGDTERGETAGETDDNPRDLPNGDTNGESNGDTNGESNGDGDVDELADVRVACRDGTLDACRELLQRAEPGSDDHGATLNWAFRLCSELRVEACDVVLQEAEPDDGIWLAAFDGLVTNCPIGSLAACAAIIRTHDPDGLRLGGPIGSALSSCRARDVDACQRVAFFADEGTSEWDEARELLAEMGFPDG
jgi:hypothetical protein